MRSLSYASNIRLGSPAEVEAKSNGSAAFATVIGGKPNTGRLIAPSLKRVVLVWILPQAHSSEDLRSSFRISPAVSCACISLSVPKPVFARVCPPRLQSQVFLLVPKRAVFQPQEQEALEAVSC